MSTQLNGIYHMIITLVVLGVGLALIILEKQADIGVTLILTVSAAWFIPYRGTAIASDVKTAISTALVTPVPAQPNEQNKVP